MGTHRHHTTGSASQRQQQLATGRFYQRVLTLIIWLLVLVLLAAAGLFIADELRTSRLQSKEISRYAQTLTYDVQPGPSHAIVYPKEGPFDKRQGYSHLPLMLERLQQRDFSVQHQAQFSPALLD